MGKWVLMLTLTLCACAGQSPTLPPIMAVCATEQVLVEPTVRAAERWTVAIGRDVVHDCGAGAVEVTLRDAGHAAAIDASGVSVHPEMARDVYELAITHELGHWLEGMTDAHAESGVMAPDGGDGRIDDDTLGFVCGGRRQPCETWVSEL